MLTSVALVGLAACSTIQPQFRPTLADLTAGGAERRGVRVLLSVQSVAADSTRGTPAGIEARVRLQNESSEQVRLAPQALELVSAELQPWAPSRLDPPDGVTLEPGEAALVSALFPLPAGVRATSPELRALNLRCVIRVGERTIDRSATFERVEREPRVVPYAVSPWGYGFGPSVIVVRDRRR